MHTSKQESELNAVSLFQGASGLLPGYELAPGSDPPDVVAQHGAHMVGIEVRRLFADEGKKGSPQRRQLSLRRSVINRAQKLHRATEDRWYIVKVFFSASREARNDRVEEIAETLVALVRGLALADNESRGFRAEDHWGPNWPKEVDLVTASLHPGAGPPEWGANSSGWVGHTSPDLIQNALHRKESPCASFPERIQDRWLLLVCDGSVESSMLRLHGSMEVESYASSYDRAFVVDFSGKESIELNLEKE